MTQSSSARPAPDEKAGEVNYVSLSKTMSKALRHSPDRLGITLAPDGSVELSKLVDALNRRGGWPRQLDASDVLHVVEHGSKQRFAVEDGRIRARYGHSIPFAVDYQRAEPPAVLYHGTSEANVASILQQGLLPMGRQVVHLSVDVATARQVGSRHRGHVVIFQVDAQRAYRDGVAFYCGNDSTWLADEVPATYLRVL